MKIVYLSNGQACYLKEQIGEKYIINKVMEYYDDENGYQEFVDSTDIVVDKIYIKQPVEKISKEVKELEKKMLEISTEAARLSAERVKLSREVQEIARTMVNNEKFIINKTDILNAKEIVLFPKTSIMPYTLKNEDKNFRGLRISMEINILTTETRSWGYELYYNYGNSGGDYLCEKYGILINPTDEEIEQTIIKRCREFEFSDYIIAKTDDKYLTEEQKKTKSQYNKSAREKRINELKEGLKKQQTELKALITK